MAARFLPSMRLPFCGTAIDLIPSRVSPYGARDRLRFPREWQSVVVSTAKGRRKTDRPDIYQTGSFSKTPPVLKDLGLVNSLKLTIIESTKGTE